MITTYGWITKIIGTDIVIIAVNEIPTLTGAIYTNIILSTGISIIAGRTIHWRKYTSPYWIAGIFCAGVTIITHYRSTFTNTGHTLIICCTSISIITGRTIRCEIIDTTLSWITGIVCTGVIIVTRNRSPLTSAVYALITCCTGISIIAGRTIHWRKYTSPYWIAGIFCAGVIIVTRNKSPLTYTICTTVINCTFIPVITGD
jgi:hypothetical protein